jgi:hypothetical protein
MLSKNRYDEDRVPTSVEKVAVKMQARQLGVTFAKAWKRYMKREQALMDVIMRADKKIVDGELERGAPVLFNESDVLATIEAIMRTLDCCAYRAMFIYNMSPETETDPTRTYHELAPAGTGSIDDADMYSPDPHKPTVQ